MALHGHAIQGGNYLLRGVNLLTDPRFRPFLIIPLLINVGIFIVLTSFLIGQFQTFVNWAMSWIPNWEWFSWLADILATLIWVLFAVILALVYGYSFSMITNILAAPFYGLLAEKVQKEMTGTAPPPISMGALVFRAVERELVKLWYFLTRGLGIVVLMFLLGFIPGVNLVVPIIGLIWAAWSMAIQYGDYAADNNLMKFKPFREHLSDRRNSALGFGVLVVGASMLPLVNIFLMPAAVIGGTLFWLEELQD